MAECVRLIERVAACSRIFCCLCAIIPRKHVWKSDQYLSKMTLAIHFSWIRAVLLISCFLWPFHFRWTVVEGRTLARAVAILVIVSWRVMPAYVADRDANELDASPVSEEGIAERMIIYCPLSELLVASDVFAYAALS